MNNKGFTLIEAIVSLAIASLLLAAGGMALRLLHGYTVEEGAISSAGDNFNLTPAASQVPAALNIHGFARAEAASSTWSMVTDLPLNLSIPPSSDRLTVLHGAAPSVFSSASNFRSFLQMPASGLQFSSRNGYCVLYFDQVDRVSSLLNLEWWDDGDFRFYIVSFHASLTSSAIARYTFSEPIAYTQVTPSLAAVGSNAYRISLPDPGIRYSLEAGRLARAISDPVALSAAIAALDRDGGLSVIIPSRP